MLTTDDRDAAAAQEAYFQDERINQYWDGVLNDVCRGLGADPCRRIQEEEAITLPFRGFSCSPKRPAPGHSRSPALSENLLGGYLLP
jgi:hypothetical protein